MNSFKSHFWYHKNQRNGILFLLLVILGIQFLYLFADFSSSNDFENETASENELIQAQIDSLKALQRASKQPKIFPFNPNYLSDFKGYQLGMNVEEIDRLFAFRETGKFINSKEEFQKVTQISDSLLTAISPYFKFPEWTKSNKSGKASSMVKEKKEVAANYLKKDLNTATSSQLQAIKGIGEKLAKRIVAYRKLLHGFTTDQQLYEVYYLDKEVANRVLTRFTVIQKPVIQQLNINTATFKEILHLPYIDYDLTKKICNYRDQIGAFKTIDHLKKIDSFPLEKFDRIALYLTAY